MYICSRCKTVVEELPENNKCRNCNSRIFYKKRDPIVKKVNTY